MQPRLLALKSAVPPYLLSQQDVLERAARLFGCHKDIERLLKVFPNTGIERRFSCVPIDWYERDHGWRERNALYLENAVKLLETVTLALLEQAELEPDDLDAIVVTSTTGIATPSLDALLVEKLKLRRDIRRLPIFGLGCAGGVIGLARAAELVTARPGARVLFLVVEFCALTFRRNDHSKSNIIATALFGDGAAGAILSTSGDGRPLEAAGEHTWPHSLDIMGWEIEDDGLKTRFSQSIPTLVANEFGTALHAFLRKNDIPFDEIKGFACHPGGAKVLDALEAVFGVAEGGLCESRAVLRDFGNMSAATALFVLERLNWKSGEGRILLSAMGPGFTAAFATLGPK